jgi:RimJ/RimL family protein N-acetyltransferase
MNSAAARWWRGRNPAARLAKGRQQLAAILSRRNAVTLMLAGEKICLGPLVRSDGPILFGWLNKLAPARLNGAYRPNDENKFNLWFSRVGEDPARVVFAIRLKRDMRLLGFVQFTEIDPAYRTAALGILIGAESDQSQGFGQEAVRLAVQFGWEDLNLQRLSLFVFGDNPRAVSAYLKVGFEVEGTMRRAAYTGGKFLDITVMGLLRPDTDG